MSQGKTEFRFTVNAAPEAINQVFQNYLAANQFMYQPRENANYYFYNDPMVKGKRSLEYYINGNQVLVFAYLNTYEKPGELEGFVGALPKQSYRNDLQPLFMALQNLDQGVNMNQNMNMNQGMNMNQSMNMNGYGQVNYGQPGMQVQGVEAFTAENDKRKEQQVIIGFVISLLGIVLSYFGITYGVILIFLEFYLAIQGLNTRKRGLAIATLVLASLSVAVLILSLIFAVTLL